MRVANGLLVVVLLTAGAACSDDGGPSAREQAAIACEQYEDMGSVGPSPELLVGRMRDMRESAQAAADQDSEWDGLVDAINQWIAVTEDLLSATADRPADDQESDAFLAAQLKVYDLCEDVRA